MVEYGLLSALVSIVAIVTLKSIAPLIRAMYIFKKHISSAT
jgi:Flp pilus assembly pilin Flp